MADPSNPKRSVSSGVVQGSSLTNLAKKDSSEIGQTAPFVGCIRPQQPVAGGVNSSENGTRKKEICVKIDVHSALEEAGVQAPRSLQRRLDITRQVAMQLEQRGHAHRIHHPQALGNGDIVFDTDEKLAKKLMKKGRFHLEVEGKRLEAKAVRGEAPWFGFTCFPIYVNSTAPIDKVHRVLRRLGVLAFEVEEEAEGADLKLWVQAMSEEAARSIPSKIEVRGKEFACRNPHFEERCQAENTAVEDTPAPRRSELRASAEEFIPQGQFPATAPPPRYSEPTRSSPERDQSHRALTQLLKSLFERYSQESETSSDDSEEETRGMHEQVDRHFTAQAALAIQALRDMDEYTLMTTTKKIITESCNEGEGHALRALFLHKLGFVYLAKKQAEVALEEVTCNIDGMLEIMAQRDNSPQEIPPESSLTLDTEGFESGPVYGQSSDPEIFSIANQWKSWGLEAFKEAQYYEAGKAFFFALSTLDLAAHYQQHWEFVATLRQNMGIVSFHLGRYSETLHEMTIAATMRPGEPKPWYWIGRVHEQKNDFVVAFHYYELSLNRGGGDLPAARRKKVLEEMKKRSN